MEILEGMGGASPPKVDEHANSHATSAKVEPKGSDADKVNSGSKLACDHEEKAIYQRLNKISLDHKKRQKEQPVHKKKSKQFAFEKNPYYNKNQLFVEADKLIDTNILQPFFKSAEEIDQEVERKNLEKGLNANVGKGLLLDESLYNNKANAKLNGPALVFDIISKSDFVADPLNSKFEINKGWYNKAIDDRSTVIHFIKTSGHQFHTEAPHRLNDLAQRLKPNTYRKGDVLKPFGQDPSHLFFICSGSVVIKEKQYSTLANSKLRPQPSASKLDDDVQSKVTIVNVNTYTAGQNFGDPELNFNTPLSS
jgi:hypothetical protein